MKTFNQQYGDLINAARKHIEQAIDKSTPPIHFWLEDIPEPFSKRWQVFTNTTPTIYEVINGSEKVDLQVISLYKGEDTYRVSALTNEGQPEDLLLFNLNDRSMCEIATAIQPKTPLHGTALYSYLRDKYSHHFQEGTPSFGNLIWQLVINEAWVDKNFHCFVPVLSNIKGVIGMEVGIAEYNESGYYPTHVFMQPNYHYDKCSDILDEINRELFGLLEPAVTKITLSSLKNEKPRLTDED